jgi:hypothetical protein
MILPKRNRTRWYLGLVAVVVASTSRESVRGDGPVEAHVPPAQRPPSPAAEELSRNYVRAGWRLVEGRWHRPVAKISMRDLFRVSMIDGRLDIQVEPSEELAKQFAGGRTPLIEFDESAWAWIIDPRGRIWTPDRRGAERRILARTVSDEPSPANLVSLRQVQASPESVTLNATGFFAEGRYDVQIIQHDTEGCTVLIHLTADPNDPHAKAELVEQWQGSGLLGLLEERSTVARRFVRPVLAGLGVHPLLLGPGAGDVYRVFNDIESTSAMSLEVSMLVARLADVDPVLRLTAERDIASLGASAIPALLRVDRASLSPGARVVIDRLLARQSRLSQRSIDSLRDDLDFLLDVMYQPDPRVRERASARLRDRFRIEIPVDADPDVIESNRIENRQS